MFADVTGRRCIRGRRSPHSTSQQRQPACRTSCPAPVWWFERCAQNPIPSRTRPLNAPAPMVLCLKTRESRSPPDLPRTRQTTPHIPSERTILGAGWSSPVARQAHNLKVTGSNPVPATKSYPPTHTNPHNSARQQPGAQTRQSTPNNHPTNTRR